MHEHAFAFICLGLQDIAVFSTSASSDELSDRSRFPYFMRMIPPDSYQVSCSNSVSHTKQQNRKKTTQPSRLTLFYPCICICVYFSWLPPQQPQITPTPVENIWLEFVTRRCIWHSVDTNYVNYVFLASLFVSRWSRNLIDIPRVPLDNLAPI